MDENDIDFDRCPICGGYAALHSEMRDSALVDCPRCGDFELSRTALVLASRKRPDRERARASYAVRHGLQDPKTHRVFIDSTTVDKLFETKLPAPEVQIDNVLRWIADAVGDDMLGPVELPADANDLAAVIGAVNGERVDELLAYAEQERLVRHVPDNFIALTPKGRRRLEDTMKPATSSDASAPVAPPPAAPSPAPLIVVVPCPECGPGRRAKVMGSHARVWDDEDAPVWQSVEYRLLECCGCETPFVEKKYLFSEEWEMVLNHTTGEHEQVFTPEVSYWPVPVIRKKPEWIHHVPDPTIIELVDEVYEAFHADLRTIAAMGVRAILDLSFVLAKAPAGANFKDKLDFLEANGTIGGNERDRLAVMTDAGSAAAHRAWKPSREQLVDILDATEHLLKALVVLDARAAALKAAIPPRPKK